MLGSEKVKESSAWLLCINPTSMAAADYRASQLNSLRYGGFDCSSLIHSPSF